MKNQLPIYKDSSGEFVNEKEFELTYNMPIILRLKDQFGDCWQDYYRLFQSDNFHEALILNPGTGRKQTSYCPKGKLSTKIFEESKK